MSNITNAFKSKTVWLGLGITLISWVQSTINDAGLSPEELSVVGTILGAAVIVLRAMTTTSLSNK